MVALQPLDLPQLIEVVEADEGFDAAGLRLRLATEAPGAVLDDALTVACGDGAVRLLRLQRAGKGPQDAAEFLRGRPVPAGSRL